MARVRNQMYRLLTPEQQAVLNEKTSATNGATARRGAMAKSYIVEIIE